ncbi:hypothetical protein [uncultured Anaeromusa sp.]|uniref:hypothetical protein n=1 Tax=uncultured Anaeromusa sp. TaxID=673273 RepID=UPI0029C988DC|nr:hypothetical protein [uncultured Anaeromusa sp.]
MGNFTLNIQGQLNSIKLSETKALWPLFEAIVNSIQSIEDSNNKNCGKISIFAQRETDVQTNLIDNENLGRFKSFIVTDNGSGFDSGNYESFNTAYSAFKVKKGCKGIGRFLWLKAFRSVEIESTYIEKGISYYREFNFSPEGVTPDDNVMPTDSIEYKTTVMLNGFDSKFQEKTPIELSVVAKRIIEHCLLFFISNNCPEISITDGLECINLNEYYKMHLQDSLHQDRFKIEEETFVIYHLMLPDGVIKHELHLCANMHEVKSVDLSKYIPELQKKIHSLDNSVGFYYVGYLTSSYLDSIVNTTRTDFKFDVVGSQLALAGTGEEVLIPATVEYIKGYLSDYLVEIKKEKHKQISDFVSQNRPQYKYLLEKRPEVYDRIPAGLKTERLEIELHKEVQAWETEIKEQGQQLTQDIKNGIDKNTSFSGLFEMYCSGISEFSKTCLAEYVARRKTLLDMLEQTLTIQDNGKFKREDAIHSIICPMRHTSDDMDFEEMNLWMIDERLAYHKYLASDKTLKSLPVIDCTSKKEPDIVIFDQAFAFSDDDAPLNTITIIEFKKPDNKQDNPLSQIGKYIDAIRTGNKKRANGMSFCVSENTSFRCFAICDLSPQMRENSLGAGLQPTPDGTGYYGYQPGRKAYYEVISYTKLLADAKKRNQVLFDKLFSPKVNEAIHFAEAGKV